MKIFAYYSFHELSKMENLTKEVDYLTNNMQITFIRQRVNNRPAYNAGRRSRYLRGRLGNALKGHFSRGTTVPVFTVFMKTIKRQWKSILNEEKIKTIREKYDSLPIDPGYENNLDWK